MAAAVLLLLLLASSVGSLAAATHVGCGLSVPYRPPKTCIQCPGVVCVFCSVGSVSVL